MSNENGIGRRQAVKLAALGMAGALSAPGKDWPVKASREPFGGLKVGLASYTTRKLSLDDTIAAVKRLQLKYIALKSFHLPLESTTEERKAVGKKLADAGLTLMGCGVINLKNNEKEIRDAFQYCQDVGSPTAVISPDPDALPTLDRVIKEFPNLRAAIHNHGPEDKKFPSPDSVFKAIQTLDKRIGCCVDVGHTFRLNEDPAAAIRMVSSRLYDVHLKDLAATGEKPPLIPVGRGVMDIPAILKALVDVKFTGHVALEWEDEADNPIPGMAESYGFVRGVFARA